MTTLKIMQPHSKTTTPLQTVMASSQKILTKRGEPTSLLGMLMARGQIPKAYAKTITQYEILRSYSLSDGPIRPQCLLLGKPRLGRKYAHTYVRDVDVQKADRIQRAWRESVYILQSYACKDMVDTLLQMEAANQALLSLCEIHRLRSALRDLTRYYGKQIAA